jgi:hypothetical protein
MWEVIQTAEYREWFQVQSIELRAAIDHDVQVLAQFGPRLGRPWVDTVSGSKYANLKELRTRLGRQQFRSFFAFDPSRRAVLLVGGEKSGDPQFYRVMIARAEQRYELHLKESHLKESHLKESHLKESHQDDQSKKAD